MHKANFHNMPVISWWSALLVKETGASRENHRPAVAKLYDMMLYRAYIAMCRTRIHNFIT